MNLSETQRPLLPGWAQCYYHNPRLQLICYITLFSGQTYAIQRFLSDLDWATIDGEILIGCLAGYLGIGLVFFHVWIASRFRAIRQREFKQMQHERNHLREVLVAMDDARVKLQQQSH